MKKTFVKVVAAAALIMGLAGCNQLTKGQLDVDGTDWSAKRTNDKDKAMQVIIEDTDNVKLDTTWFVWTDEKSIVLPTQPKMTTADGKTVFQFTQDIIEAQDYNAKEGEPALKSERFILYIGLKGTDKTKGDLAQYDARGRICVYEDSYVTVNIEKYPELVAPMGVVEIENDEPTLKSTFVNGDYTITEIWPLNPQESKEDVTAEDGKVTYANAKVGGKYVVNENLAFKNLSVAGKAKAESTVTQKIKIPVKSGKQIIGLYQPNRGKSIDGEDIIYGGKDAATVKASYADIYGITEDVKDLDPTKEADAKKIIDLYKAANLKTVFANEITVPKHDTVKANSNGFVEYCFIHEGSSKPMTRTKAVSAFADVELYAGSLEK